MCNFEWQTRTFILFFLHKNMCICSTHTHPYMFISINVSLPYMYVYCNYWLAKKQQQHTNRRFMVTPNSIAFGSNVIAALKAMRHFVVIAIVVAVAVLVVSATFGNNPTVCWHAFVSFVRRPLFLFAPGFGKFSAARSWSKLQLAAGSNKCAFSIQQRLIGHDNDKSQIAIVGCCRCCGHNCCCH